MKYNISTDLKFISSTRKKNDYIKETDLILDYSKLVFNYRNYEYIIRLYNDTDNRCYGTIYPTKENWEYLKKKYEGEQK